MDLKEGELYSVVSLGSLLEGERHRGGEFENNV